MGTIKAIVPITGCVIYRIHWSRQDGNSNPDNNLTLVIFRADSATTPKAIEQLFAELAACWKRERGPYSSSARLADHPAYQQIISLGPAVVPLLLRELEREPDHWFRALHALTGANPVPEASRGRLPEMAQAWLDGGVTGR